jgi:hypothetical protein
MVERGISDEDVLAVLAHGKEIESYPGDVPYPSRLVFGWCGSRPIHVVSAENSDDNETIIVTVYEPDPGLWSPDLKGERGSEVCDL